MRLFWSMLALLMALTLQATCLAAETCDLDAENIRADAEYLCNEIGVREAGTEAERAAADWIWGRLHALGYAEDSGNLFRAGFATPDGRTSENLGVTLNPDPALPLCSIVAHYDSAPTTPGARDNAASVAILLEIARCLKEDGAIPGCELRLVFLGSEENGYHGAQAYVVSLSQEDRARHAGAFNMDVSVAAPDEDAQLVLNILGGRNDQGEVVDAVYLPKLENGVTRSVARACEELYGWRPAVFYRGESDHVPFQSAGLEAANVCWRRVEDGQPMLPPCYHSMEDTPKDLDWNSAVITGRCVLRAVEELAAR